MEFSRQEYWSEWPFPSPGDLPNPRIEPRSPTLQADSLLSKPPGKPYKILALFNITAILLHSFLVAQMVQNLPAMWETWVRSLGQEDPLEKGKATHSSSVAWTCLRSGAAAESARL